MIINKILKYFFIASLAFTVSCATTIKVKYLQPAEINLGLKKKIAILNFSFTGSLNGFSNTNYNLPEINDGTFSNILMKDLINTKSFKIIERQELSKVMAEQALSNSGFVNSEDAIKLGRLSGAEVIILGSGAYYVDERMITGIDKKEYNNRTVTYKTASFKRTVSLNLSYRIVDVQNGEIIDSKKLNDEKSSYVPSFPVQGTEIVTYKNNLPPAQNEEKIYYYITQEKAKELSNWKTLLDSNMVAMSEKIVYQLTPHYMEDDREVKDGNTNNMKQALEMSKKGDWENAKYLWETVIKDPSPEAVKDYENALYNLALYYEISNEFDKSIFYFDQAFKYSNNHLYLTRKAAIEKRKREIEILKEQGLSDLNTSTKKIAKEDQTDNIDHLQLAIKFQAINNYPEAIKEFKKVLEKSPNDLYANNSLATINYTQGKYEEALNYYNKVISIDPNQGSSYFNLAITYQALGRINEAKDTYLKACQLGFKPGCDVLLGTK